MPSPAQFLPTAYLKGQFLPFQEANISIATQALHYGTAAFGGLRVLPSGNGEYLFFRLDRHSERLSQSAKYFGYDLSSEKIANILREFVIRNAPKEAIYIRPLVYVSDLGISPRLHEVEKDFLVYGMNLGDYLSPEGITACFSSWMRQSDQSFPLRGKMSGAYIASALTKTEAHERGFDEGIMLGRNGKVSEASGMNIFIVRKGEIITPWVSEDILEGITRASVMEIARSMGYTVTERSVDKTELLIADEVFLTGTAAKIAPVKKIEQYSLPMARPITLALQERMNRIVRGEDSEFSHFIERVRA